MKSYDDHVKNCESIWDGDKHWESYLASGTKIYLTKNIWLKWDSNPRPSWKLNELRIWIKMLFLQLILQKVHDDYENHLLTALSYDESVSFNPGQG